MSSIKEATVEGVNTYIKEQRGSGLDTQFLLVQFDDEHEQVYSGPIGHAPMLTLAKSPGEGEHRFVPRASTALLDAIGNTIVDLGKKLAKMPEAKRPAKVVVVIMTDGMENASTKYTKYAQIGEMIRVQRDTYNWQFLYLGANQDAIATAAKMDISAVNAVTYAASNIGTKSVMRAASRNTRSYGATGQSTAMYFMDEDRVEAMKEDEPAVQ